LLVLVMEEKEEPENWASKAIEVVEEEKKQEK
jgi:hypothetical protein